MPPRMIASRAEGGNAGGLPWRIRVLTAARNSAVWPAKYCGAALDQPRPAQVAGEAARPPGRRQPGVVGGDHDLRVEALGGAAQRRERVLAGGAAVDVLVVEDVQLRGHRPAGQVAAPRRRGGEPGGGQERMGGGEPARGGVETTVIPPGASSKRSSSRRRRSSSASRVRWAQASSSVSCRAVKLSDSVSTQGKAASSVAGARPDLSDPLPATGRRLRRARSRARCAPRARRSRRGPRRGHRPPGAHRPVGTAGRPRSARSKKKVSAPTGPSATRWRPRRIATSPVSPRAQRTTCRLASVPRGLRRALELVGELAA